MRGSISLRVVLVLLVSFAVVGISAGPVLGQAVIYEPFDYPTDSGEGDLDPLTAPLNGTPVNPSTGLSGNWSDDQTVNLVTPVTLPYGDLPNAGGQIELSPGNSTDAWVTTSSVLADAGLLNDGATLWFSTMFMKASGGGSNEWAGFAFGSERLDAAYNGARMQNTGNGVGFTTRNMAVTVGTWSDGGQVDQGGSIALGGAEDTYPVSALIVGKIEWGATAVDDETITLYAVSTTDLETLGTGVSKTVAGFDQTLLDIISMTQRNSGGIQTYDEIRFGETYDDVIGAGSEGVTGDANGDGVVDAADYILVKQNMGLPVGVAGEDGDFNETGTVDWDDLQTLIGGMSGGSGAAVPEPATLALLAMGAVAVVRRRRK